MAISTQRIIVIVLMIDLMVSLVGGFVYGAQQDQTLELETYTESYENWTKDFREVYPADNPDTATVYLDRQFGDAKAGGTSVWNLLSGGIGVPEDIRYEDDNSPNKNVKTLYTVVAFFLAIINILLGYELFLIFYSRKTS